MPKSLTRPSISGSTVVFRISAASWSSSASKSQRPNVSLIAGLAAVPDGFHGDADSQDETGENTNCRSGFQYELQNADCTDKPFLQKSDIHDGESPGSFEKR